MFSNWWKHISRPINSVSKVCKSNNVACFCGNRLDKYITCCTNRFAYHLEAQFPEGGFQKENGLSREETLKGMTIWAAYSNFEEDEKGSIESGKFADFIILDRDIMTVNQNEIPKIEVLKTFINGDLVRQQ